MSNLNDVEIKFCYYFYVLDIFAVKALPSAGIIPLLQMFCPNKTQNKHGFPIFPESKYVTLTADICNSCFFVSYYILNTFCMKAKKGCLDKRSSTTALGQALHNKMVNQVHTYHRLQNTSTHTFCHTLY
jgi:hypothetical protein